MPEWLTEYWARHRYKTLGFVLGLVFSLLVLHYGLLAALFITACVGVGYWIGKQLDEGPEGLGEWLERLLPPGRR